ncbi:hypothetical protein [Streptomyces yokosukanensis]
MAAEVLGVGVGDGLGPPLGSSLGEPAGVGDAPWVVPPPASGA